MIEKGEIPGRIKQEALDELKISMNKISSLSGKNDISAGATKLTQEHQELLKHVRFMDPNALLQRTGELRLDIEKLLEKAGDRRCNKI